MVIKGLHQGRNSGSMSATGKATYYGRKMIASELCTENTLSSQRIWYVAVTINCQLV